MFEKLVASVLIDFIATKVSIWILPDLPPRAETSTLAPVPPEVLMVYERDTTFANPAPSVVTATETTLPDASVVKVPTAFAVPPSTSIVSVFAYPVPSALTTKDNTGPVPTCLCTQPG